MKRNNAKSFRKSLKRIFIKAKNTFCIVSIFYFRAEMSIIFLFSIAKTKNGGLAD